MGIKELKPFLKSENVNCFFEEFLYNFGKTRVAIDGNNWYRTYLHPVIINTVRRMDDPLEPLNFENMFVELISEFVKFNLKFIKCEITPVWVWDGVSKVSKKQTKDERRENIQKRIDEKINIRDNLLEMSVLERPLDLLEKYKNLLINTVYMPSEYLDRLKKFSRHMGIPTLDAPDEGENLCSYLAIERIVSAVWSADTDCYAIGAPIVIKGFVKGKGPTKVNTVFTPNILLHFDLTHKEFRDFCIMCGTDFNQRIKGYGPKTSMKYIKKYRSIDNIAKELMLDVQILRHEENRELLNGQDSGYLGKEDLLKMDKKDMERLEEYDKYEKEIKELKQSLRHLPDPLNVKKQNLE